LHLQNLRWQSVLDTARDAIIGIDEAGLITLFNRAAEEMFGYQASDVLGQNVAMLMPAPYREEHDSYLENYRRTAIPKAIGRIRQVKAQRRNGEVFPIELSVSEARADGAVLYTAIVRDVSERHASEHAIRRARDFAERLIETAQAIVLVLSPTGKIVRYNSFLEKLSGRPLDAVVGADWFETFLPPADRATLRRVFDRARSNGIRGHINPIVTVNGELRQIEWHANPLRNQQGEIEGVLSVGQDVTEQLEMIESLRESEARFASFMDHLPGVAFMKDRNGRYVYVNRTFEQLFGHRLADLVGKDESSVWNEDVARSLQSADRRVIATGQVMQSTESIPHADGVHQWWINKFPVFGKDGNVAMVAGVAIDITERVQAEEALLAMQHAAQQKERLADIGAITAQIAHDLGNPLAAVSMQAQLILRRIQRNEEQPVSTVRRSVEQIVAEVGRLTSLIREFLEFSREQRLAPTEIVVADLLDAVADTWRAYARQNNVTLRVRSTPHLPPLRADVDKLRRVLDNLVRNAIEAIEGRGNVTITARLADPTTLRLTVEDTGSGISENVDVFRLFETTKFHGTGLGLPIAKQIVQAHGGRIEYSHVEPRGTAFVIELPSAGPAMPGAVGTPDRT